MITTNVPELAMQSSQEWAKQNLAKHVYPGLSVMLLEVPIVQSFPEGPFKAMLSEKASYRWS